jgi:hypothetical protein
MVTYVVIRVTVKVFNATFNNISVIWCVQFYWRRKLEYSEITTDLQPNHTTKHKFKKDHDILQIEFQVLAWNRHTNVAVLNWLKGS